MSQQTGPCITAEQGDEHYAMNYEDLSKDMQSCFDTIVQDVCALRILDITEEASVVYDALFNQVTEQVTEHPVLAKIFTMNERNGFLLAVFCETDYEECHPVIKLLIETNPHALLWNFAEKNISRYPRPLTTSMRSLAGNRWHCVLMPWIAQHFPWVFDHESYQESQPAHITLALNHSLNVCDASVIRKFYELQPQGLCESGRGGDLPLHICMSHGRECDSELIKWMCRQYPASMLHETKKGWTALHHACSWFRMLTKPADRTDTLVEVCRFLASECPASVRMVTDKGVLPIHFITPYSNHAFARNVMVHLLRAHPQSIDMVNPHRETAPRSNAFVQSVLPLLEEERSLKEEIPSLANTSTAWYEATQCSKSVLQVTVSNVFKKWATLRMATLRTRLEQAIPERIMEVTRDYQGEDEAWDERERRVPLVGRT